MARMHDAGIIHNDLHPGNLLLGIDADDWPQFFLIDLHAVRLRRPLDVRASRDNLVMFNRWFTLRVGRADRLRFLHAYCRPAKWTLPSQTSRAPWSETRGNRTWTSGAAGIAAA